MSKPGDLPERSEQLSNAREKVFRPRGNFLLRNDPVASLSSLRGRRGDGILIFKQQIWTALTGQRCHEAVLDIDVP